MNRLCKCGCQEEVTNKNNIYIVGHNRRGIKFTEEEIIKHKIRTSGINNGMYGKLGKNNPNFGSKHSEETKLKMSKKHSNINNSMWNGGNSDYWSRELRKIYTECCLCGSKNYLNMHHKDHNNKNNKRSNLIIICSSCHRWWHTN